MIKILGIMLNPWVNIEDILNLLSKIEKIGNCVERKWCCGFGAGTHYQKVMF